MDLNKLPKGWKDISIKQYSLLRKVKNSTLDRFDKIIQRIAIISGESYEAVSLLKITELTEVSKRIKWIDTEDLDRQLKDTFTIDGVDYKITLNATELTGGQYASIVTKVNKNEPFEILHEILASISLPVGVGIKEIEPSYYSKTAELFANNLSIVDAYPIGVFFCEVSKNLTKGIQDYLQEELKRTEKIRKEMEMDFISNGDGSQLLTTWLTEMEQNGTIT